MFAQGRSGSTYTSWRKMRQRCSNPNAPHWRRYGGANPPVTVCARWHGPDGFKNFVADLGERPEGTTLGRHLDSGNYEPGNCEWQTDAEQKAEARGKRAMRALHAQHDPASVAVVRTRRSRRSVKAAPEEKPVVSEREQALESLKQRCPYLLDENGCMKVRFFRRRAA